MDDLLAWLPCPWVKDSITARKAPAVTQSLFTRRYNASITSIYLAAEHMPILYLLLVCFTWSIIATTNHGTNRGRPSPFDLPFNPNKPGAGAHYILPKHLTCQVNVGGGTRTFYKPEMKAAMVHDQATGAPHEYRGKCFIRLSLRHLPGAKREWIIS